MPRYYALAAGESEVKVKSIYMTEIETLECQIPFVSQRIGGTFRCVLKCHPECSDLGCQRPDDDTACTSCRNSKFLERFEGKPDVPKCVGACELSENLKLIRINDVTIKDTPSQIVCSSCHHECKTKCKDLTEYDCEGADKCVNFKIYEEVEDDNGNTKRTEKCIKECPVGYWARLYVEDDNLQYYICEPCPDGCKVCNLGHFHNPVDGIVEELNENVEIESCKNGADCFHSDICLECRDDYLSGVINITHSSCHETRCAHQFQNRNDNCVKAWRAVGYQNMKGSPFTATCETDGCDVVVGKNFLRLGDQDDFEKFKTKTDVIGTSEAIGKHGIFSFQLRVLN